MNWTCLPMDLSITFRAQQAVELGGAYLLVSDTEGVQTNLPDWMG